MGAQRDYSHAAAAKLTGVVVQHLVVKPLQELRRGHRGELDAILLESPWATGSALPGDGNALLRKPRVHFVEIEDRGAARKAVMRDCLLVDEEAGHVLGDAEVLRQLLVAHAAAVVHRGHDDHGADAGPQCPRSREGGLCRWMRAW